MLNLYDFQLILGSVFHYRGKHNLRVLNGEAKTRIKLTTQHELREKTNLDHGWELVVVEVNGSEYSHKSKCQIALTSLVLLKTNTKVLFVYKYLEEIRDLIVNSKKLKSILLISEHRPMLTNSTIRIDYPLMGRGFPHLRDIILYVDD